MILGLLMKLNQLLKIEKLIKKNNLDKELLLTSKKKGFQIKN